MPNRRAVSLLETLIVIAIIGVLIGLLLPAFSAVRRRAVELTCKNNLKQLNLGVASYFEIHKKLPPNGQSGIIGGWTIEILPFIDQKNIRDRITPGQPISSAPDFLIKQPRIMTCPMRDQADPPVPNVMHHAHYLLVPVANGKTFILYDAPLDVNAAWASGPTTSFLDTKRKNGPHNGGFFVTGGFNDSVSFSP